MLNGQIETITSLKNPLVKEIVKLKDKRSRDRLKKYAIEGYREVLRALRCNVGIDKLLICKEYFLGENENTLIKLALEKGIEVFEIGKDPFYKMSYRDRPDGLIATARPFRNSIEDVKVNKHMFILVIESIEKPGNLGTILRSCDAVGVDLVIVCDQVTDIYNPNVIRSSLGALFSIPVVKTSSELAYKWLKKHEIHIVSTSPSATKSYTEIQFDQKMAIVMGSEQYGLTDFWLNNSEQKVFIPMKGIADSLNVATATTLMLYEVLRQKGL